MELDHVRGEMHLKQTEELVEMLALRDEEEWQPEVFAVVEEVLRERGIAAAQAVAAFREQMERPAGFGRAPAERLVVVADCATGEEAHLCCMTLAQGGVEAVCSGPPSEGGGDGWRIQVASEQVEAARELLDAVVIPEGTEADDAGFRCGRCGFISEPLRERGALVCQVCGAVHGVP